MKKIFLSIAASSLLFCSCEKTCTSTITTDQSVSQVKIDGKNELISNGETVEVKKGSTISLLYGTQIYYIEECGKMYVVTRRDGKDYMLEY